MHSLSLIPCSNLYTCANRIAITHAPTPSRVLHCSTFSLLELENRGLIGPKDLITHGGGANVIGVHQELGQTWAHSNTHTHSHAKNTASTFSDAKTHKQASMHMHKAAAWDAQALLKCIYKHHACVHTCKKDGGERDSWGLWDKHRHTSSDLLNIYFNYQH